MAQDSRGDIKEEVLQDKLNGETGKGKTEVNDIGNEFEVVFNESNRYYIVDKDGNIGEAQEIIRDNNPGDFTIGENGEKLDGSVDKPYEISCIEDLVILSNLSRGKGNYIENGSIKEATRDTFSGKQFILTQTLNFNSTVSYADLSVGWRYDEGEEAYIIDETSTQNLRDLLIDRDGVGFVPISENTASSNLMFAGNLDGQGFEIQNLYENTGTTGGLFCTVYGNTIENLGVTNVDITSSGNAAGIVKNGIYIYNCYVSGKIKGSGIVAGIGGINMINCCNLATLEGKGIVGGLKSEVNLSDCTIVNCYNLGEIKGKDNYGNIGRVSGILGAAYGAGTRNIINTCSLGSVSNLSSGTGKNFYSVWGGASVNLENCYYLDSIINEKVIANENSLSFFRGDTSIIDKLNEYVNEHKYDYAVELYAWELNDEGLPTFKK